MKLNIPKVLLLSVIAISCKTDVINSAERNPSDYYDYINSDESEKKNELREVIALIQKVTENNFEKLKTVFSSVDNKVGDLVTFIRNYYDGLVYTLIHFADCIGHGYASKYHTTNVNQAYKNAQKIIFTTLDRETYDYDLSSDEYYIPFFLSLQLNDEEYVSEYITLEQVILSIAKIVSTHTKDLFCNLYSKFKYKNINNGSNKSLAYEKNLNKFIYDNVNDWLNTMNGISNLLLGNVCRSVKFKFKNEILSDEINTIFKNLLLFDSHQPLKTIEYKNNEILKSTAM